MLSCLLFLDQSHRKVQKKFNLCPLWHHSLVILILQDDFCYYGPWLLECQPEVNQRVKGNRLHCDITVNMPLLSSSCHPGPLYNLFVLEMLIVHQFKTTMLSFRAYCVHSSRNPFRTYWSSELRVNPSGSAPYPTTGGGHWDAALSSKGCWLLSGVCWDKIQQMGKDKVPTSSTWSNDAKSSTTHGTIWRLIITSSIYRWWWEEMSYFILALVT